MTDIDDDLDFFYQEGDSTASIVSNPWQILIVDDEEDIHSVTKIALKNFEFEGRKLSFTHAYTAQEALALLKNNNQFALVFIDVVMESDHAGLELVKAIRNELKNKKSRLILRTGQPGFAPEDEVIQQFDINDYRNKSELTASKLKTTCYTALRSYRDLCDLERSQFGLEEVITATNKFQQARTLTEFSSNLLAHIANVAQLGDSQLYCSVVVNEAGDEQEQYSFRVLTASGEEQTQLLQYEELPLEVRNAFTEAVQQKSSIHTDNNFVGYFHTNNGTISLIYVSSQRKLSAVEHNLLEYFSNSVGVSYENMNLKLTIQDSHREMAYLLGEAVEKRSQETGSHVRRVANYCYLLAIKYGLSEVDASHLKAAAPLHDVGKVAIPDSILHKPGKLTPEEWVIMHSHAQHGQEILSKSSNQVLKLAAIVAGQHHEKWDGTGYPNGLKGEEIHIAGRITALADVFDALSHARCYKPAYPEDQVLDLIRHSSGSHFEPKLVEIFFENLDAFRAIKAQFHD